MHNDRKLFLLIALVLVGFGTLMVHSASITSRPSAAEQVFLSRHLAFAALGTLAALAAGRLPPAIWRRFAPWFFWGTCGLLVLVLVPGVGARVNGAQRWFRLGPWSFQPAELLKLSLPLYVCTQLHGAGDLRNNRVRQLAVAAPVALVVPLVMLQPDLGTALFLAMGGAIALAVGGWPLVNFAWAGGLALPAIGLAVWHKPYQMQRIAGFITTWSDWTRAPYHLKQSLVTLGAGGTWGAGLGRGFQKLSFLPEANSDFVFAVIGEELGLLGTLAVVSLWCAFYVVGLRMLRCVACESFEHRAAFTLLTQLALQAALNVAVVTAMVPPKGIPHPFISYGGSNLAVSLIAVGMICGLTRSPPGNTAAIAEQTPSLQRLAA